jgi:ATP-dependent metalloprotease
VTGYSRKELLARLDVAMGVRVAEEILSAAEVVTTGASSDLNNASGVAKAMVTKYGMSPVGLVTFSDKELGMLSGAQRNAIDTEIKNLLEVSAGGGFNWGRRRMGGRRVCLLSIGKSLIY